MPCVNNSENKKKDFQMKAPFSSNTLYFNWAKVYKWLITLPHENFAFLFGASHYQLGVVGKQGKKFSIPN